MKLLIAISLFGFNVLASDFVQLSCVPTEPCQHAENGLEFCVTKIEVGGRIEGTEKIKFRTKDIGRDYNVPTPSYSVQINRNKNHIYFSDETGDQNGLLKPAAGGRYEGRITVDEDFEFEVTCSNKAIGYE